MANTDEKIGNYMTQAPCTVDAALSLADAQDRMTANNIRHLLAVEGNRLVGVISTRDIAVAAALPAVNPKKVPVRAAMSTKVFACAPDTLLSEVAFEMETHRYGCTVVIEENVAVGIFTTTDALRALRQAVTGKPAEPAVVPTHVVPKTDTGRIPLNVSVSQTLMRDHAAPYANQGQIR